MIHGRRFRVVLLVIAIGAAVAGAVAVRSLLGSHGRLQRWCAAQIVDIVNAHLTAVLSCDSFTYTYPNTLDLSAVALTSDGKPIISADAIRIEFAQIPRPGRPIVISSLSLKRPVVRLIEQQDGSLLGLSDLVKKSKGAKQSDGGSTQLSDVLAITAISIAGGTFQYEPWQQPPMRLTPLTLQMNRSPAAPGDKDAGAGWYNFKADAALDPVVDVKADAGLNLNTGDLKLNELSVSNTLTPAQYQVFPPNIQEILRKYELKGKLHGSASGMVPLADTEKTDLSMTVDLKDASATFGDFLLPLDSVHATGTVSQAMIDFPTIDVDAYGGTAKMTARQWLEGDRGGHFEVGVDATDMKIEDSVKSPDPDKPVHSGEVWFSAQVLGSALDLPASLSGAGTGTLKNGRLKLLSVLSLLFKKSPDLPANDHGEVEFEVTPDAIKVTKLSLMGRAIGVTGAGSLFYSGDLNMLVNAGPVERMEGAMGPVGEMLSLFTDRLVPYQVTGRALDPKVAAKPLGIGVKDTGAPAN